MQPRPKQDIDVVMEDPDQGVQDLLKAGQDMDHVFLTLVNRNLDCLAKSEELDASIASLEA